MIGYVVVADCVTGEVFISPFEVVYAQAIPACGRGVLASV